MEQNLLQLEDIMDYYISSMPCADREDVSRGMLEAFARHALFLRKSVDWCRQLPVEVFLENVAAYRINSERIEDCRHWFYEMVMPLLSGLTLKEAILEVNLWCCANAGYHQADERTANAVAVYKSGYGRCGEESTFAVTVLRSVGIAARQVYAPLWSHCDDNHAWVEVWCDGRWQYFGACEPEPVLNKGWFDLPASKAMLIHGRTFGESKGQQETVGRAGGVTYYNVTSRYGDTAEVVFFCVDEAGRPMEKAAVRLAVLNYAHFGEVATLFTDENGRIRARLGMGSLRLSALWNGLERSALVRIEKPEELLVKFQEQPQETWVEEHFFPPEGRIREGEEICPESFVAFQEKVEVAKIRRQQRIVSYYDPARGGRFPEAEEILRMSGGNFEEVIRFLEMDDDPYRLKLLKTLSQKDYYDCRADVLQEHLECALAFAGGEGVNEDIFVTCVLNPRIEYEELGCWRRSLAEALAESAVRYRKDPCLIWNEVCGSIRQPVNDAYDTLRMCPLSVYKSGRGSRTDQKNLFVAAARSLGIPARRNPETGNAEFYQKGAFHPADRKVEEEKGGRLTLLAGGEKSWTYWTDWCLEYWEEDGYSALNLEKRKWEKGELSFTARQGCYRVTTVVRLPSGNQLAKELHFRMGNEDRIIPLERHEVTWEMQAKLLPAVDVRDGYGHVCLDFLRQGKKAAYIWLREGEEPTEHILNELLERISDVKNYQESIFLLSKEKPKPAGTLEKVLRAAGNIGFYQVDGFAPAQEIARIMGAGQLKYPLAVSTDEAGRGIYMTCGYNVGSVAQILFYL